VIFLDARFLAHHEQKYSQPDGRAEAQRPQGFSASNEIRAGQHELLDALSRQTRAGQDADWFRQITLLHTDGSATSLLRLKIHD
jgi:hypothetical protein